MCAPWERDVLRFIDTDASSCTLTPPSDSLSQYGSDKVSGMSHIRPYYHLEEVFFNPIITHGLFPLHIFVQIKTNIWGFLKNTLS